ncbi:hypothetical protein [Defluviimonas sp. SAOS-178_SWC]|uniref:hypothetical protein n=1 Tax=Defluviimonas sp. SAOS-178_SWC TaxID=3121287 RepID=UPI003221713D
MASQIKTEMPKAVDINAVVIAARARQSEAVAELLRDAGRGILRLWARLHTRSQAAH